MGSKVLLILFSAVNCAISSQLELPRGENDNPINDTERLPFNPCVNRFGPNCLDCKTHLTCADDIINMQQCSYIDPKKPYCKGSACTSEPITGCEVNTFRCTSIGSFPNPTDCTQYYYCPDLSMQGAIKLQCPTNYAYDSYVGFCKQIKTSSDCSTINCVGQYNRYQIHAADKSILIYCADTPTIRETVLFRCKDKNMEYDPETLQCKYVCKTEGRFVDILDCRKYYDCYKIGNNFAMNHVTCPSSFKFDAVIQMCVFSLQC